MPLRRRLKASACVERSPLKGLKDPPGAVEAPLVGLVFLSPTFERRVLERTNGLRHKVSLS